MIQWTLVGGPLDGEVREYPEIWEPQRIILASGVENRAPGEYTPRYHVYVRLDGDARRELHYEGEG